MWTSFIGFMACGKSTITRRLQAATNRPTISLDQEIEEVAGVSVASIFEQSGAADFRARELATLQGLDVERPLVVDTGGGIVETPAAVEHLRACGVVIWLDAPWAVVRSRLKESHTAERPLLGQLGWDGVEELFRKRRWLYAAAADFRLRSDRGTAAEIAQQAMLRSLQWERRREVGRR